MEQVGAALCVALFIPVSLLDALDVHIVRAAHRIARQPASHVRSRSAGRAATCDNSAELTVRPLRSGKRCAPSRAERHVAPFFAWIEAESFRQSDTRTFTLMKSHESGTVVQRPWAQLANEQARKPSLVLTTQ